MIRLPLPSRALHGAWLEAMREFEGETLHGFSTFGYEVEELALPDRFEHWLAREARQRVEGQDGFVPATVWWIVDDDEPERVLGSIHLRHELDDWLLAEGGHIGYGVRPSARPGRRDRGAAARARRGARPGDRPRAPALRRRQPAVARHDPRRGRRAGCRAQPVRALLDHAVADAARSRVRYR
ncbi:hypothetical protein OVA14_00225 [Agrococcus sp. SL85]|nr:hypothetical protein [Agrococcus sp. SL85]WAC66269.1 hypothetical protein OVA14_00225 [Agrococcus sp. SL85]